MQFANTRIERTALSSFEEIESRFKHGMTKEWNRLTAMKDDQLGCVRVITDWYANKNINLHQYFALMNAFGKLKFVK